MLTIETEIHKSGWLSSLLARDKQICATIWEKSPIERSAEQIDLTFINIVMIDPIGISSRLFMAYQMVVRLVTNSFRCCCCFGLSDADACDHGIMTAWAAASLGEEREREKSSYNSTVSPQSKFCVRENWLWRPRRRLSIMSCGHWTDEIFEGITYKISTRWSIVWLVGGSLTLSLSKICVYRKADEPCIVRPAANVSR